MSDDGLRDRSQVSSMAIRCRRCEIPEKRTPKRTPSYLVLPLSRRALIGSSYATLHDVLGHNPESRTRCPKTGLARSRHEVQNQWIMG